MKRYGGDLWDRITSIDNLERAANAAFRVQRDNAQKRYFAQHRDEQLREIQRQLLDGSFEFTPLHKFRVYEPKERIIHCPKFYPDKIVHHAIIDVLRPYFITKFIDDTYGSIKGRGITGCAKKIIRNRSKFADWYFIQLDVRKFYQSIDHDVAKAAVARVFKDKRILDLFGKVIDRHSEGLAIGVYPSQYIANLVLSDVDHYAKEQLRLKWYFRYMDDIVCFVPTKEDAHRVLADLKSRIEALKLEVKESARIAPFSYGIDFIGYKFYPTHTMLRKRIKLHMKRKSNRIDRRNGDDATWLDGMAAFWGWCKIGDCKHLWKTLKKQRIMEYKRLSEIKTAEFGVGLPKEKRISINDLIDKEIIFFEYKKEMIKGEEKVVVKFAFPEAETDFHYFITKSEPVKDRLCRNEANLPFIATIKKKNDKYTCFE